MRVTLRRVIARCDRVALRGQVGPVWNAAAGYQHAAHRQHHPNAWLVTSPPRQRRRHREVELRVVHIHAVDYVLRASD